VTRDEALARVDLADLLDELGQGRGLHGHSRKWPCPRLDHAQTGSTPPVTIKDQGGTDVWYCHVCKTGGSAVDALVAAGRAKDVGEALEELGVEKPERQEKRRVPQAPAREVAKYLYADEQGNPLYEVVRMEPKSFRQRRWEDGRWQWGLGDDTRRVLYRLPEVLDALKRNQVIFVVEGEKDADRLWAEGKAATTCAMGAGKWEDTYTDLLTGASHKVIVIGDDDDAGHKHAADVWRRLTGKVGQVIARLPAEGCKDVSEMLDRGVTFTSSNLRPLVEEKPANGSASGPIMLTARAMSARPRLGVKAQVCGPLFQRGMRTVIGAGTGEGKTTFALAAIRALVHNEPFLDWRPQRPGRALIIDLEQGEEVLKRRIAEAHLDDTEAVDVLWEPSGMALDQDPAHQALIRDTVRQGHYDLVLMDPLYQMHIGSGNDEEIAASLMNVVDAWSREFDFSLVIPMHARKPHPQAGKNMTIHDIAGVGTWLRNAEFVLGLQVMSAGQSRVHFFKDRVGDGPDIRSHWFLNFNRASGYSRSRIEEMHARRAEWNEMLARSEGVTLADLSDAGADINFIKKVKKDMHVRGDRWRAEPWHKQEALATDEPLSTTSPSTVT
jgi:5S rRNA maturation endonuclease (ribonuclease M5)